MNRTGPLTIHYTQLPPAPPGSSLAVEWDFYRREVGRLIAEGHEGRHVLIRGEQILGFFDRREAALEVAYDLYLGQAFLVHRIQTRERQHGLSWMWGAPRPCLAAA
jgi:hypothetical protein